MQKELTVSQASRILGITLDYVYRLIYSGKLVTRKSEGRWLIPVSDVESRPKLKRGKEELMRRAAPKRVKGKAQHRRSYS